MVGFFVRVFHTRWINVFILSFSSLLLSTQISANEDINQNLIASRPAKRTVSRIRSSSKYPLAGESQEIVSQFNSFVKSYSKLHTISSNTNQINVKKMLHSLENFQPKTFFVQGHVNIMKASLYYKISLKSKSDEILFDNIQNSPYLSIRDLSVQAYVSNNFVIGNYKNIQKLQELPTKMFSFNIYSYLSILSNFITDLSFQDTKFLLSNLICIPQTTYEHPLFQKMLLSRIQNFLSYEDFEYTSSYFLFNANISMFLFVIKMFLNKFVVSKELLSEWQNHLRFYPGLFIRVLRTYSYVPEYKEFLLNHDRNISLQSRGKKFFNNLSKYNGDKDTPYQSNLAETCFCQYLEGPIEMLYLESNTKILIRNFLSIGRYDKIIVYFDKICQKVGFPMDSVYINFWAAYAFFNTGEVTRAIDLFSRILAKDPESYYGILSRSFLNKIFEGDIHLYQSYSQNLKIKSKKGKKEKLFYASILYYLDRVPQARQKSEKIFKSYGFPCYNRESKILSSKDLLFRSYLSLGLHLEARRMAHMDGIENSYIQDSLIFKSPMDLYSQNMFWDRMNHLLDKKFFFLNKEILYIFFPKPFSESLSVAQQKSSSSLDSNLIYSIVRTESSYRTHKKSPVGAVGLMQLMPNTAKWLLNRYLPKIGFGSIYSPETNIVLGSVYIYEMIKSYGLFLGISAYNSGPGNIRKLSKRYHRPDIELVEIHPKKETRDYVRRVIESYQKYSFAYGDGYLQLF